MGLSEDAIPIQAEPPPKGDPGQNEVPAEELPAESVVVRYGEMKDQDLTVSVWSEYDDTGRWGLSVLCRPKLTALQLINLGPLKHRVFRVSTVGAISEIGPDVLPDNDDPPHAWIMYQVEPTPKDWGNLRAVFGDLALNPHSE